MQVRLFCNPAAGRGRGRRTLETALEIFAARGASVTVMQSRSSEHLTEMAATVKRDDAERIVIVGGDGTLHHFLRGLPLDVPLGLIPSGSGDDFAAALSIPRDIAASCDAILAGKVRHVDVALANGIRYLGVAGLGFDSVVARHANSVRYLRGSLVYLWSILRVLPSFTPKPILLAADGEELQRQVMFAVFANSSRYGGGIKIAPAASLDDGLLECYLTLRCSKFTLLTTLPRAYSGRHVGSPFLEHRRGRVFDVQSPEPLEVYADGEFVTMTPVKFTLAEERLGVYVP